MAKLAINGGTPIREKEWPKWAIYNKRELELISEVTKSGNWSFNGPKELEFAQKFVSYFGKEANLCS